MARYLIKKYVCSSNSYMTIFETDSWSELEKQLKKMTKKQETIYIEIRTNGQGLI